MTSKYVVLGLIGIVALAIVVDSSDLNYNIGAMK